MQGIYVKPIKRYAVSGPYRIQLKLHTPQSSHVFAITWLESPLQLHPERDKI